MRVIKIHNLFIRGVKNCVGLGFFFQGKTSKQLELLISFVRFMINYYSICDNTCLADRVRWYFLRCGYY